MRCVEGLLTRIVTKDAATPLVRTRTGCCAWPPRLSSFQRISWHERWLKRPRKARCLSADVRAAGIKETILLTGDSDVVARQIGKMAQVDRVIARCLPEDKVHTVKELVQQKHRVLMVGDGINDAPALAAATVGMALGSQGLTAAASAADTVLLSTDILRVVRAVRLGRWVMHVARQGIWVGMGLSVIAMLFATCGFISPAAGAILQEGIDVIVILNALRAGRITF